MCEIMERIKEEGKQSGRLESSRKTACNLDKMGMPPETIARAVEELFGVKVAKVNTISVRGRYRRQGLHGGYTAASKKAIVTLKEGSKGIDFFESMV